MKQLFLCERTYPLYRTIVRAIQSGDDIDILLSERTPGLTQMAQPLRESGIFRNVYVYEDPYYADFQRVEEVPYEYARSAWETLTRVLPQLGRKLAAYARFQRRSRNFRLPEGLDITAYDEIYVDELPSAAHFYLLHQDVPLICVEHGNNCFQNYKSFPHTRLLILLDRLHLLYATRGCSRRYAAVEVSEDNGHLLSELKGREIRERSMNGMVEALTAEQGDRIFQLYCQGYDFHPDMEKTYDVVLVTTVYHQAAYDEAFQIGVFRYIVAHYTQGAEGVLLKPHPRDPSNYEGFGERCSVVPRSFPGEVLAMSQGLRIRRAITVVSSTISTYRQAQEQIVLGLDFVKEFDAQGNHLEAAFIDNPDSTQ